VRNSRQNCDCASFTGYGCEQEQSDVVKTKNERLAARVGRGVTGRIERAAGRRRMHIA